VRAFVDACKRHIAAEESALQELFDRWIDERDRAALGKSMQARRSDASGTRSAA
jgi:hypothetical protein